MRATAIILTALAVSMAFDGELQATPFLLGIALACWLKHRSNTVRPTTDDEDDAVPLGERLIQRARALVPTEGGRHG